MEIINSTKDVCKIKIHPYHIWRLTCECRLLRIELRIEPGFGIGWTSFNNEKFKKNRYIVKLSQKGDHSFVNTMQ